MLQSMILLLFLCSFLGNAAPDSLHPNRVINLPGAPLQPEFPMYSGYLNASLNGNSSLFYVLVESMRVDPSTAPLLVWFNGGPGGSSLIGFFTENGPYRVTEEDGILIYNEFSWNQYANVLYLEGPVGVGFSINNQEDITTNDELTADNNFYALHDFMTRVHPNYAEKEFYLTGQSYAGSYIPWLSRRILRAIASEELQNKNFKGFAIGNPKFDETSRYITTAMAYLTYGLIPQNRSAMIYDSWQKLLKGKKLNRHHFHKIHKMVHDIYWIFNSSILYNIAEHCPTAAENNEVFHRVEQGRSYSCYASNKMESFLNKLDVQKSLHVIEHQSEVSERWESSNDDLHRKFKWTDDTVPIYKDIIELVNDTSFRMLIYHGDVDAVLPVALSVYGTNKIAAENSLADQGYPPVWHFFGDFAGARTGFLSASGQVSLDVLTVRGAGHSVPTSLPEQAFQMINNFIFTENGEPIDYSKPIRRH